MEIRKSGRRRVLKKKDEGLCPHPPTTGETMCAKCIDIRKVFWIDVLCRGAGARRLVVVKI